MRDSTNAIFWHSTIMNITLIGMAGAGKSVTGKKLADRLDYKFIDIDEIIETNTCLKLQQIIDDLGDDGFLEIEERTVLELDELDNCIISPGGSVIYSVGAMRFLKENSAIVFLDTSFKSIQDRITDQEGRGIIGLKKKSLEDLYDERQALYKKYADIEIEVSEACDVDTIVERMVREIFN